jgi:hypothetical protein
MVRVVSHGNPLARCAREGDLVGLQDAIARTINFDVNSPISKSRDTLLHATLSQNRIEIVNYLLETFSAIDVNTSNEQGVTPLMVAVASCPKAVPTLLAKGADPCKRGLRNRKTVLDLAHGESKALLHNAIRKIDASAPQCSTSNPCCPYCGVQLKSRTRLDYMLNETIDNQYVKSFFGTEACRVIATNPEYHVLTSKRHLKKEISESWAIFAALETLDLNNVTLVDLCAGSSLTTTIFGLMYPHSKGIAVDLMNKEFAPHLGGNLSYLQCDIKHGAITSKLDDCLGNCEFAVLVGMHLCGDLSICAIEIFSKMPQFKAIVLSPCCFPKTGNCRMDPDSMTKLTSVKDEHGKYAIWSDYLLKSLSKHCTSCFSKQDANIISSRNTVLVGFR